MNRLPSNPFSCLTCKKRNQTGSIFRLPYTIHWKFSNKNNTAFVQDNSAAMMAATPAVIDINYILAERSREYFGEGHRWFDLVRTQKWNELAGTYRIGGAAYGNHTPQTITRTIEPKHYLPPIPQRQIDGMEMTAEEKQAYQNPGYQ